MIVERGVFFGSVFFARPLTVVSHTDGVLASYLAIGTEFYGAMASSRETIIDEFGRGELVWGKKAWVEHNALVLVRPDDPYSVMGFWNEAGAFVCWYVNLQDALRWTPIGYDTRDHTLDLIVGEDLSSWMWKDEHEMVATVGLGMYTAEEAESFRRNGEAVIELVESGNIWWRDWRDWAPDPSLPIPTLPDGWDDVASYPLRP